MSAIKGFSSNKKLKSADGEAIQRYATIQPAGAGRTGQDMLPKAVYEKLAGLIPEASSTEDTIVLTGNTAKEGDLIRFTAGPLQGEEVTVLSSDGTNIELSHIFDNVITTADEFALHGYLTLTVGPDGSLVVTQGPTQINRGSGGVYTPAEITKDLTVPTNTIPMPVEIVSFDGNEITITAGDINVRITDIGALFDSTRVGDGSGNYIAVSADQEGQVHDPKSLTELQAILAKIIAAPATEAKQDDVITALGGLATNADVAKEAKQDVQITALGLLATEANVAKEAKQDTMITAIGLLATEATLAAMSAKLPATLGSKADADSLSVTQSTEDKAIQDDIKTAVESLAGAGSDTTEDHYKRDFNASPLTTAVSWQTLRTLTADIKRISVTNNSGNELLIRNQATAKTIIVGAGADVNTSLLGVATDIIQIQAITADAVSGIIYLNFEG